MADKQRYKIKDESGVVDGIVGLKTVTVEDKTTGKKGYGSGSDKASAEKKAWEDLKKKQGPPSSQGGS